MLCVKHIRKHKLLPTTVMTDRIVIIFTFPVKSKEHGLTLAVTESVEDALLKKKNKRWYYYLLLIKIKSELGHTVVFFNGHWSFSFASPYCHHEIQNEHLSCWKIYAVNDVKKIKHIVSALFLTANVSRRKNKWSSFFVLFMLHTVLSVLELGCSSYGPTSENQRLFQDPLEVLHAYRNLYFLFFQ